MKPTRIRPLRLPLPRLGAVNRVPWVPSSATADKRLGQAICYLVKAFNHEAAFHRDLPTMLFAKVVCNLRNFYLQDQESTVKLILTYFNPKCWDEPWSPEAVRLMWEYVEPFTPYLGLVDEDAVARQKAALLEREAAYLLEWVVPGGKVLDKDLLAVFQDWNPDLEATSYLLTTAVSAVTGLKKVPSNSKQYWVGFHLPTAEELERRLARAA